MTTTATITETEQPTLRQAALIGALGVVFGDIGTSPLYAYKEALHSAGNVEALRPIIFGCVSLVFWALIIVVSIKYVLVVMRATNDGEGGIMALTALAVTPLKVDRWREAAILVGLVGAALFYGDCIITPAISVLSAVEGLEIATPVFKPYIVPIAAGILAGLFILQSRGTARIGTLFGPIMIIWFAVIGLAGLPHIFKNPEILGALNPAYGLALITEHGWTGFHVLGSVFLVLTGAEALYADEGHFLGDVIRVDWFSIVLPGLLLNYFGQGALVLHKSGCRGEPFLSHVSRIGRLYPAVGACNRCNDNRQPGRDQRRIYDDPAGDPAWLSASYGNPVHIADRGQPNLRPADQLDPCCGCHRPRSRIQDVQLIGRGLRRRRVDDDARHDHPRRRCCPLYLGLEPASDRER